MRYNLIYDIILTFTVTSVIGQRESDQLLSQVPITKYMSDMM